MEPLYDDVILPQASAVEQQEKGLELKENVAYGTAKPTDLATDTLHEVMNSHQEQGLELTENVAYGTTKSMTH